MSHWKRFFFKRRCQLKIMNKSSLGATIDRLNDILFWGKKIGVKEKREVARWIASRQGMKGSYCGMFAPTEKDFKEGLRVFTGERIKSRAGISHILGEETIRNLILLKVSDKKVQEALKIANRNMSQRIADSEKKWGYTGTYCCGICTASFWRNLVVGGLGNKEKRISAGLKNLKKHRKGDGKWRRYPFFYTLLALSEIDTKASHQEMKYAALVLERYLQSRGRKDKYSKRKSEIARRVLEII